MATQGRVLVLGINCMPELTGIGKLTGEMVSWLANNDYETAVVTGFPYYPHWKVQQPYSGKYYKKEVSHRGKLRIYRCPMYVPERPSGLKRLIHEASFFLSALLMVIRLCFGKRYDYIFSIAPPFHLGFLALFYRFFRGGRIVYHIQDLQVDAAKELNMLPPEIFPLLFRLEKEILKRVNYVSTISEGMIRRVKRKVQREILFFPNWVDTARFFPIDNRASVRAAWGFRQEDKIVLYSGSVGEKQGLDVLIEIADNLKADDTIQFIICGNGPYKRDLMQEAARRTLKNIHFFPLQQHDVFNSFLNMADVHLVLQKGDASDLVMPSKLTTILSVGGLVLVTANKDTTLHQVVMEHNMGVVIPAEDGAELQKHIQLSCSEDFSAVRNNARKYAEQFLDKENVLYEMLYKMKYSEIEVQSSGDYN